MKRQNPVFKQFLSAIQELGFFFLIFECSSQFSNLNLKEKLPIVSVAAAGIAQKRPFHQTVNQLYCLNLSCVDSGHTHSTHYPTTPKMFHIKIMCNDMKAKNILNTSQIGIYRKWKSFHSNSYYKNKQKWHRVIK